MEAPVLEGEGLGHETKALDLNIIDTQVKHVVKPEGSFDWDKGNNVNIRLGENGSKRSSLSCDDGIERVDIGMEVKKNDDLDDQAMIGGGAANKMSDDQDILKLKVENKDAELDCDMGMDGNAEIVDDRGKMGSLSCDDNIGGVDIEVEVPKKDCLNDEMQIGGQVLGSVSKGAVGKISDGVSTENEEVELKQQSCDLELGVSKSGSVGSAKTRIKRSGRCFEGLDIEMELKKLANDEVKAGRRVLRSMSNKVDSKIFQGGEDNEVLVGKNGENEHVCFEKIKVKVEKEEGDCFVNSSYVEGVSGQEGCKEGRKLKRRRGRPRKLKVEEQDHSVDNMEQKCGSPSKLKMEEQDQSVSKLKRKRGRPPKVKMDEQDLVGNMQHNCVEQQDQSVGCLQQECVSPPEVEMEEQDQFVGNMPRKRGRPPKQRRKRGRPFKVKMEVPDQLVGNTQRKCGRPFKVKMEEQDQQLVGNSQQRRGRPFNVKMEVQDQLVGSVQQKRGRPFKVKMEMQDQLSGKKKPGKRGRPPKSGKKFNNLGVARYGKGKMHFQKGRKGVVVRDSRNKNAVDMCLKTRACVKESEKRRSPVKNNECGSLSKIKNSALTPSSMSNSESALLKNEKGVKKTKKLVRQHILKLLLAAGWIVDYRPRNGREEYKDAVYVSPDGKTHWSITLAYKRLQMHCEAGDGEGKVYIPGFKFVPIASEEFNILTKVMAKIRKDKGRSRKVGNKSGGSNVSLKGKVKRKRSLVENDNLDDTSHKRIPVLVKCRKRQKTHNKKRSVFMVRNAEEIDSETDGYTLYSGKQTVFAWMIDLGTVLQNERVQCVKHRREDAKVEGRITRDGIHCDCCNRIVTMLEFEAHAGSKLSDPLKNIHIERGMSLLQCLLDSWNKQDEHDRKGFHFVDTTSEDPNDEACGVCGDGGDLICCDNCPSTFHQSCLNMKDFPPDNWRCIYCSCKFCELVDGSTNDGDGHDDFTTSSFPTCRICDQKYHRSCVEVNGVQADDSNFAFYCGSRCEELSKRLEMLLGVKHDIEDGLSWTFIRRSDVGPDASQIESQMVECNSKLAVALSVMDECFMPYIDHRSGINLIHSILYSCGSNFNRLDYSGFITAILERGDEVIGAASIRIRGNQLAEMPFIGIRYMYRRQGMCRQLLNAIESALSSLDVELLVIPAVSEVRDTWTSAFGFEPLEVSKKQMIKNFNLLVFPHVDMLMKEMKKLKVADEDPISVEVSNTKLQKNQSNHDEATDCDEPTSLRCDSITSAPMNGRHVIVEFGSPDELLDNPHHITEETVRPDTSPQDKKCEVDSDNLTVEDVTSVKALKLTVDETVRLDTSPQDTKFEVDCDNLTVEDITSVNAHKLTEEETVRLDTSPQDTKCEVDCDNLTVEDMNSVKPHEYLSASHLQDEEEIYYDCVQTYPNGLKEINSEFANGCDSQQISSGYCSYDDEVNLEITQADTSNVGVATAANLHNLKHYGDCQSIQIASGSCNEDIAKSVDLGDKPGINQSSELPEHDFQVNQIGLVDAPSFCGTSCGNTEVMVLPKGSQLK